MASVNELLKILKKDGWFLYSNGANHDLYRHATKRINLLFRDMAVKKWQKEH